LYSALVTNLRDNIPLYLICTLAVANAFIWQAVYANELRDGILTVAFLDVGQGDAIYIEAPNGNQMLIDGGNGGAVLRELGKILPSYDRTIDIVLSTHPDQDHIGGLPEVFNRYTVLYFIESGIRGDTSAYTALVNSVKEEGSEYIVARRGTVIWLDEGVAFTILFPDRDLSTLKDTNTGSIVARLVYGETEFLFTGDSPRSIEEYLVYSYGDSLKSDVLKVGHHGSRTSTAQSFLATVQPALSIISAGKSNRYGHPHKEVLDSLSKAGSAIESTYENGTLVFKSDGEKIWKK
jgi:competence protein ComEC